MAPTIGRVTALQAEHHKEISALKEEHLKELGQLRNQIKTDFLSTDITDASDEAHIDMGIGLRSDTEEGYPLSPSSPLSPRLKRGLAENDGEVSIT